MKYLSPKQWQVWIIYEPTDQRVLFNIIEFIGEVNNPIIHMALKCRANKTKLLDCYLHMQLFTMELMISHVDVPLIFSTQSQMYLNQLVSLSLKHDLCLSCESCTPHDSSILCPAKQHECQHFSNTRYFDECGFCFSGDFDVC